MDAYARFVMRALLWSLLTEHVVMPFPEPVRAQCHSQAERTCVWVSVCVCTASPRQAGMIAGLATLANTGGGAKNCTKVTGK